MKTIAIYWDKFSKWVDKNLGYFLTNPHNHWRLKDRLEAQEHLNNKREV
jgi:hypothetical protein